MEILALKSTSRTTGIVTAVFFFLLSTLALAASTDERRSGEVSPVSVSEWKALLGENIARPNIEALSVKSTNMLKEASALMKEGQKDKSIEKTLRGFSLSSYTNEVYKDASLAGALNASKEALLSNGVTQATLDASIQNIESVLPSRSLALKPPKSPETIRKATSSEMKAMKQAITERLTDPASAMFGDMRIIGNQKACVTVNSKNSLGGYAGASAVYLVNIEGKWRAIYDTKMNVAVCTEIAQ